MKRKDFFKTLGAAVLVAPTVVEAAKAEPGAPAVSEIPKGWDLKADDVGSRNFVKGGIVAGSFGGRIISDEVVIRREDARISEMIYRGFNREKL